MTNTPSEVHTPWFREVDRGEAEKLVPRWGRSPLERFWDSVHPEPNSGCWLWTAELTEQGYGKIWCGGKRMLAHRFAYALFVSPIQSGLMLDHVCRVRCCVNPAHLEPVTTQENTRRAVKTGSFKKAKWSAPTCKYGHPFSEENTVIYGVHRRCKICLRNQYAREWAKVKEPRALKAE